MDISDPILVPLSVASCPSCHGEVMIEPMSWIDHDDGIEVCEFIAYCAGENYESSDWRRQHGMAYEMPYVYWLPEEAKIERWLESERLTDRVGDQKKLAAWNKLSQAPTGE